MRLAFLFLLWSCLSGFAAALPSQRVPATNLLEWSIDNRVGVRGGIRARTIAIWANDAPYNADNTGVLDASLAVQAALNACPANSAVGMLAGTYKWGTNVSMPNDVTLRGAGSYFSSGTVLDTQITCNQPILIQADVDGLYGNPSFTNFVTTGAIRGSTNISIMDGTGLSAGMLICLMYQFDTNLVFAQGGGASFLISGPEAWLQREMLTVDAISNGTNLTVWPPIYQGTNATSHQRAKVCFFTTVKKNIGVENLFINGTNGNLANFMTIQNAQYCWLSNVTAKWTTAYGISMLNCAGFEMAFCDIRKRGGVGNNGAGLLLNCVGSSFFHDSTLTENFPLIEVNSGSSGNVFSENTILGVTSGGIGIDSNHGPFNQFNLYENCLVANIASDGNSGGEGFATYHRIWAIGIRGDGFTNTYQFSLKRGSRWFGIERCIFGSAYSSQGDKYGNSIIGEPFLGNSTFNGGVADELNGDYFTNSFNWGVITNRISDSDTWVHMPDARGTHNWRTYYNGDGAIETNRWPLMTLNWEGMFRSSYTWKTNERPIGTAQEFRAYKFPGYEPPNYDAFPANGTIVRCWSGGSLSFEGVYFGFGELDHSVSNTTSFANNFLTPSGIPAGEVVSGSTNSYFRTGRPATGWPSQYTWPPIDSASYNPTFDGTNVVLMPSHYKYLFDVWPTEAGAASSDIIARTGPGRPGTGR